MKLRFAGNVHLVLTFATAFVFLVTLGVLVQPSSVFAQQTAPTGKASV